MSNEIKTWDITRSQMSWATFTGTLEEVQHAIDNDDLEWSDGNLDPDIQFQEADDV